MRTLDFTTEELCLEPRLRVALVTETYPPEVNGVAMTLQRMVDGLLARGHRIQLIRPRQQRSESAARHEGFEEILSWGMKLPRYDSLRLGLPAKAALTRSWTKQRPDIVHVATEGPLGWTAISAARKLRLPVTSDFHTNFDSYSTHYGVGWLRQPVMAYLRRFHNRTDATFVPTAQMADSLRAQGYRGVEVVSRGVDTALFSPARRSAALRRSWGIDDTQGEPGLALLSVGRLAPEKNLQLVLRSYAIVRAIRPQARLVVVGDGPMRDAIAQECPDAVLCGVKRGESLAEHYASADLFLFPSLTETFGNVTLEAMASGLCPVAFDYAAAREVVAHFGNGLLAPCGDDEAFMRLAAMAAGDPALRAQLGAAARAAAERLDWERVHDVFAAALQRATRQDAPPEAAHPKSPVLTAES